MVTYKKYGVGAVGVLIFIGAALWLLTPSWTKAPSVTNSEASSTPVTASTTPAVGNVNPTPVFSSFPLNPKDAITSWSFTGAYANNPSLIAQAKADSDHLLSIVVAGGSPDYDTYDLYLGAANDADLVGDGKTAYQYYNKAIAIHPKKGLGYVNMGHLMTELGAYYTAADAYARAVTVEPGMLEYHVQRLNFLRQQFGTDHAVMLAGFSDASKQFGDVSQVLAIEAGWLTDQGRYADAIAAWEQAKTLSPGRDTSSIDAEIARLQAKL